MYSSLLLIFCLIIIPLIYWYFTRNFDYWSKRGVAGPKPCFGFGNILSGKWKPIPLLDLELDQRYGKIYGMFCGNTPVLTVNDPKLIQTILVKDVHNFLNRRSFSTSHEILNKAVLYARDNEWKRLRSLTSFIFTGSKIKMMIPLINECVNDLINALQEYSLNKTDIDLKYLFGNYTMDVIAKCAFAMKINVYKDRESQFIKSANNIFHPKFLNIITCLLLPRVLLRLFNIKSMFNENSNQFIFNLSRKLLNERRNSSEVFDDLLQLMVDTTKVAKSSKDSQLNHESSIKKGLTENEILAQSWIFLLAGYETTSSGITFCFYELALNTDIQDRLFDELQSALDPNGLFDYEVLCKLPFLDAVIAESLRLYPPFCRIEREVKSDYLLEDMGITLNAGTLVHVSIYAVHHSQQFYANPETFDPNRFMPENKHKIIPYTYMPFALGPRNCVATRFALLEMKVCVAQVITRFRLIANSKTHFAPKFLTTTLLCTAQPLIVGIENR